MTAPLTEAPVGLTLREGALILDLGAVRPVLSSAPYGGGLTASRLLVNRTVEPDFCPRDVRSAVQDNLLALRLPLEGVTCALTAVDVWKYSSFEAEERGVRVSAFVTAGLGHLSAPGLTPLSDHVPGTINIFALVEAELPDAALVEAVQIVTEVKARTLAGRATQDGFPATGTSTDTVTVALLGGPSEAYCGPVTPAGRALARAVAGALTGATA